MTAPTSERQEQQAAARRRLLQRGPIWLRITAITALVLVAVFVSTMILAAVGIGETDSSGGGHSSGQRMEMGPEGSGRDHGSGGEHESGDTGESRDHSLTGDDSAGRDHNADD